MRTAIKRALIHSYCHGIVPAALVALAFRALNLRSL